jgi:hypothetical protein
MKFTIALCTFVIVLASSSLCYSNSSSGYDEDTGDRKAKERYIVLKYNEDNGSVIHETFPVDIFERFTEDILFLLPVDMSAIISKNYQQFVDRSRFSVGHDYWRLLIDKNSFKQPDMRNRCDRVIRSIKSNSEEELIENLASMVKAIFEVVNLDAKDTTGKNMEKRIAHFLTEQRSDYIIEYQGHNNETTSSILDRLFTYNKYIKDDSLLYERTLATTAELWSSLWRRSVNNYKPTTKQQYLVKTTEMVFRPSLDLRSRINDYAEWKIVANRNRIRPNQWRHQLVEKRIDDYVRDSVNFDIGAAERERIKMMKGTKEPKMLFIGTNRVKAIEHQQNYFTSLFELQK